MPRKLDYGANARKLDYTEWDSRNSDPSGWQKSGETSNDMAGCRSVEELFDQEIRRRIGELIVQAVHGRPRGQP